MEGIRPYYPDDFYRDKDDDNAEYDDNADVCILITVCHMVHWVSIS